MSDQLSTDLAALRIDRQQKRPGNRGLRSLLAIVVLLGAVGAAVVVGRPYLEAKLFKTEVSITEISLVSPAHASVELTSTGYVIPQSESKVGAKIGGKVARVHVKQGDPVKAGTVLFEVDPADQNAAIASALSQAGAARARAQAARASLSEIKIQAERAKNLAAQGVGPQANADDLNARAASLEQQAAAADADTKAASALVSALRVNLTNYTVLAPISGTIVNKPPEVGEFVGPQPAGVAVDMGGVDIANFDSMMVETDVPEQRLHQVKMGGPCEIVLDAYPDRRYRGKAVEVSPKIDRAKATATVKVGFVDEKTGVLPEMAARVSFLSAEVDAEAIKAPPKTIVPGSAVVTVNGARVVYVVDDGKVHLTPVVLGAAFGDGFELTKGPSPGTRVVKSPPADLADGQAIKERTDS